MKPLEWQVRHTGFQTTSWGYLSFAGSLRKHAIGLADLLRRLAANQRPFHVVTHSMGAIVFRMACQQLQQDLQSLGGLQRVVMMAPPNSGAPAAKWLQPLFRLAGKTLNEISDSPNSLVFQLQDKIDYELGIVSGRMDLIVPPSRTLLPGSDESVCLPATHNSLLLQPKAALQVVHFLRHGRFADLG